jgi:ABC-type branched-subunit amino acid transport system ATPase component
MSETALGADVDTSRPQDRPVLEARGIDFSYGSLQVLYDVDIAVAAGEILALVGSNGAGKSTVLRVAAGLDLPSRGTVTFDGLDVTRTPAEERAGLGMGLLLGGRSLFGDLTVEENLRIGTTLVRREPGLLERLEAAYSMFPRLAERRRQPASSLSGGEQQMLAMAKVLLPRPRLLMIDELSLGLAPIVVSEFLDILRQLRDQGTTIIIVEQSVAVAAEVADRAVHMEKGQVRFAGEPRQLLEADVAKAIFFGGNG